MENNESFISDAETNFVTPQQEEMHSIQESEHEATSWEVYLESLCLMLQSDPRHALHTEVLFPTVTSFVPQNLTYSQESTNQRVPEELVIHGYNLHNLRSDLLPTSESASANPRPLPTHGFLDIGETGMVWNESKELFHWRFDLHSHEAEDSICILSPSFITQFGDRVYIRLYINSDGTRYRANATSVFLVTVGRATNSRSSTHVTIIIRSHYHNYFNLIPLDSNNAFSLGREDSIIQAVHGLQDFIPTAELIHSSRGGTICLSVQL